MAYASANSIAHTAVYYKKWSTRNGVQEMEWTLYACLLACMYVCSVCIYHCHYTTVWTKFQICMYVCMYVKISYPFFLFSEFQLNFFISLVVYMHIAHLHVCMYVLYVCMYVYKWIVFVSEHSYNLYSMLTTSLHDINVCVYAVLCDT